MLTQNTAFTTNEKRYMDNPFVGIATFLKAPFLDDIDALDANIAVLGMPYDMGTAVRSGARYAPRAVREASTWNCYAYNGWYSPVDDTVYMDENWKVVDLGDVDVIHTEYDQSFRNLEAAVRKVLDRGAIPFVIGGDHAITAPILKAFDRYEDLCIIHLDAHLDYRKETAGVLYGQGNPMRRASEMSHVGQMVQIGMRGIGSSLPEDWADAKERGNIILDMGKIRKNGMDWVLAQIPKAKNYYVTLDIDVLDQSLVPGCGSPQPYGMYYEEIVAIMRKVCELGDVVGFDAVEVCPPYDLNQQTALYQANLMLDMMSFIWKSKKDRGLL